MPRILVAEDERRIASSVEKGLKAAGHGIDAVVDGRRVGGLVARGRVIRCRGLGRRVEPRGSDESPGAAVDRAPSRDIDRPARLLGDVERRCVADPSDEGRHTHRAGGGEGEDPRALHAGRLPCIPHSIPGRHESVEPLS